ncbi:MAG TPA: hypothetical protein VJ227_04460 [Patescibacteria group bacterium]|nr:hypothetical protein [Patescibacteria group bacterium]
MSVESIIKRSEILLAKAAEFNERANSFKRDASSRSVFPENRKKSLRLSKRYASAAGLLQRSAWEDVKMAFVYEEGLFRDKDGTFLLPIDLNTLARDEVMAYYTDPKVLLDIVTSEMPRR